MRDSVGDKGVFRGDAYLEVSLAGFEEVVGGGIDDETVDFPCARAALDCKIRVAARVICSDYSKVHV